MGQKKSPEQLAKFLSYVLGRRPDEFGLIPDEDGYVKIKDLLKAMCEEEGWGYVRKAAVDEVLFTLPNPPVEIMDNNIRAKNREKLSERALAQNLPKLLYTCVRRRAHAFVMENGISPTGYSHVILSSSSDMARRIGKRIDQEPVELIVQVQNSEKQRVVYYEAGETLFLAEFIPAGCFTGPPLPKQKPETQKKDAEEAPQRQKFPGSFFPDFGQEKKEEKPYERKKKKKEIAREKDKRRMRKQKQKMWE
ncbi:MAG: hypothetical protein GY749_03695 [Desulfobacteraceae bacterium]|nr:hypothetical protein [Desulfobacteraceae bacterium]